MKKYSFKVRFHVLHYDTKAYWFDEIGVDYIDARKRLVKTLHKEILSGFTYEIEDVFVEHLIK